MKKFASLFLSIFLFTTIGSFSQNKVQDSDQYITCFYPVSQIASQEKWDQLLSQLNTTEGIVKMKPIYKPEQGRGQLILLIQSISGSGENKKEFDITFIKSLIIRMGMQPEEPEIKEGIHL